MASTRDKRAGQETDEIRERLIDFVELQKLILSEFISQKMINAIEL